MDLIRFRGRAFRLVRKTELDSEGHAGQCLACCMCYKLDKCIFSKRQAECETGYLVEIEWNAEGEEYTVWSKWPPKISEEL